MRLQGAWRWLASAVAVAGLVVLVMALRSDSDSVPAPQAIDVKKASFDSEAPVTAPAHWLPPEDWVYNHWLPYDEGRLYELLGVTRGAIWRQLRDDRHNLAQLAARHGWPEPAKLATALVAPRRGEVSKATLATLRARAQRTITQGHLSQHLLFHSLHQFSIPSEAPAIFGVTDAEFRALRRGEQSPLEIGRLHGRSPARVQALSAAVLRERVRFGVRTGVMSPRQGRLLLRRQISQLPRWLAQVRYNGPPPTHLGKLTRKPRNFAANPALSATGGRVVFEGYEQKLPVALKRGEISILTRAIPAAAPLRNVSARPGRRTPRSAYNPTVSADGRRVAYESAEGNLNFAKRYGQIRVFVSDLTTGRARAMPMPQVRVGVSLSGYNPVISADGRHVAYQAQRRSGQSAVYVTDLRSGRPALASRGTRSAPGADDGVYDPAISGDGRLVAFTTAASNLGGGDLRGRTQVFVRDVKARTTTLVSRRSGARGAVANDYSADPAVSRDGRYVAFSSAARNLGGANRGSRVYVRDLRTRRTTAVSGADGFAIEPSISADGRVVAYTSITDGVSRVIVRRGRGAEQLASRASGRDGVAADRGSTDATISSDGARVAFTSAATNLAAGKPDDRRGVFVRDLRNDTTTLVSPPVPKAAPGAAGDATAPVVAGPKASPAGVVAQRSASLPRTSVVSIFDNAFFRSRDRPTVRLRAGGVLTFKWASQQSHQVTIRSGPVTMASPAKATGVFSARLSKPGTYEFVCAIHAPGMRMAAVVR